MGSPGRVSALYPLYSVLSKQPQSFVLTTLKTATERLGCSRIALMDEFYRQWRSNQPFGNARALCQASLKTERAYADPLSWAAFILIGLPRWVAEINLQFWQ